MYRSRLGLTVIDKYMVGVLFCCLIGVVFTSILMMDKRQGSNETISNLIVCGKVINMDYWNITFEDIDRSIFSRYDDDRNITIHLYNLTIFNILTFSDVIYAFTCNAIKHLDLRIGSKILIYDYYPFLDIEVYNY